MSTVKNPFALRDNRIISIGDLSTEESGMHCNCVCPSCKGSFIARMGDIRIHHFAHEKDAMCDSEKAFLISLYRVLKEAIEENGEFCYPGLFALPPHEMPLYHRLDGSELKKICTFRTGSNLMPGHDVIIKPGVMHPDEANVILGSNNKPSAILLNQKSDTGKEVALAIVLVPPASICKVYEPRQYKDYPTLSINVDYDLYSIKTAALKNRLTKAMDGKSWVSSKLLDQWLEHLASQQHEAYSAHIEAVRIRNEERLKQQIERQKKANETRIPTDVLEVDNDEFARKLEQLYEEHPEDIPSDSFVIRGGTRWIRCKTCKQWKSSSEMAMYGGRGENVNFGLCSDCARKL